MPKVSLEVDQANPRLARAILSAPYPLAAIRGRPYIIYRPVRLSVPGPGPGQGQAVTFSNVSPFFHGPAAGSAGSGATGTHWAGWQVPIAVPSAPWRARGDAGQAAPQHTEQERTAAQQLDDALTSPMDVDPISDQHEKPIRDPLRIAHEVGKIPPPANAASGSRHIPTKLNLLTSTFQTILPRSLLEYRQTADSFISPPKFTSSTSFFTGVTVGSAITPTPTLSEYPTTPRGPAACRPLPGSASKKRYGQKARESSDDDSESSGATITGHRTPLSPLLETPSTPRASSQRLKHTSLSPPTIHQASQHNGNHQARGKGKAPARARIPPRPLFLGQTNLSPFTYDPSLHRRGRRRDSGSTSSGPGLESDATSVLRVPRLFGARRNNGPRAGLFWRDMSGKTGDRFSSQAYRGGSSGCRVPDKVPSTAPPTPQLPGAAYEPRLGPADLYVGPPAPPLAPAPDSPQPMSIDPQSATHHTQSWPHDPQPSFAYSLPPIAPSLAPPALPFAKICHNALLMKHQKAARRRHLLLQHHRRVRAEAEAREEREGRMQVDTPAQASFPAGPGQPDVQPRIQAQTPYPDNDGSPLKMRQYQVSIRNLAGIARVDESKPPRKRRRDLSPESAYQPLLPLPVRSGPSPLSSRGLLRPMEGAQGNRPGAGLRSVSYDHDDRSLMLQPPLPRTQQRPSTAVSASQPVSASTLLQMPYHLHPRPATSSSDPVHLPTNGPFDHPTPQSRSLLPSIEIRTPPARRSSLGQQTRGGDQQVDISDERVRVSAGQYGHFDFERERAESMERRLLEDMKHQRRDAWLEDMEGRRREPSAGARGVGGGVRRLRR